MEIKGKTGEVWEAIRARVKETGMPPTLREMADKAGLKSTWTVRYHLKKLAQAGYIRIKAKISRGMEIVRPVKGVPILGKISAGKPSDAFENVEGYIDNVIDIFGPGEIFALKVKGDSMEGAGIYEGDTVFVRRQQKVADGEIAAALIENEALVKRVFVTKEGVKLVSENPKYPPIISKEAIVLGKVAGVVRKYK